MRLFLGSTSGSRHSPRLDFIGLTVWLFGWFCSLTLAEADARPAAVLVNEVYTGQFQGTPNRQVVSSGQPRLHHHAAWRFALFFLGGSSSPFLGGLPTPARLRTFSAFGIGLVQKTWLKRLGERFVSERNVQPKDVCRGRARGTQSQPRAATRLS